MRPGQGARNKTKTQGIPAEGTRKQQDGRVKTEDQEEKKKKKRKTREDDMRPPVLAAALAAAASARITGIAVPATIQPGAPFRALVRSSDYIQTVYDVAMAFGYAPGAGTPDSLGLVAGSVYLGPDKSNRGHDFGEDLVIPADAARGPALVTASLMSLYGALHMPVLSNYNVSVTFGDHTSDDYVFSG
ncbi:hypothetical protein CDD83_4783 [Cordyceps sp. RAO-2017]|nr:hypothetical protein CDD83_4783 [Cordyceps sp. RAO-2017]